LGAGKGRRYHEDTNADGWQLHGITSGQGVGPASLGYLAP